MTNAFVKYYRCKICDAMVEYIYPVTVEYINGERYDTPKLVKYYKAKARMEHNMTHKGLLDNLGIV